MVALHRRMFTAFMLFVLASAGAAQDVLPLPRGVDASFVLLDYYVIDSVVNVTLTDPGQTATQVTINVVAEVANDSETVVFSGAEGIYTGSISIVTGTPTIGNGIIETFAGDYVEFNYNDTTRATVRRTITMMQVRLLENGSFESGGLPQLSPWTSIYKKDKVECSTPEAPIPTVDGNCAFVLKGGGADGKLILKFKSLPEPTPNNEGIRFWFPFYVHYSEGRTLKLKGKFTYANGKSFSFAMDAIDPFTPIPGQYNFTGIDYTTYMYWRGVVKPKNRLQSIKLIFQDKNTGGKIYIDGVDTLLGPSM